MVTLQTEVTVWTLWETATSKSIFKPIRTEVSNQSAFLFAEPGQAVFISSFSNTQKYAAYLSGLQPPPPHCCCPHICPNIHFCGDYHTQVINGFAEKTEGSRNPFVHRSKSNICTSSTSLPVSNSRRFTNGVDLPLNRRCVLERKRLYLVIS